MTEAVSWELAEKVAARVAGREPLAESYHYASLQPDFEELTAQAEELVAEATGLRSLSGRARVRVTDRPGWVRANLLSFRRLLRPITDKVAPKLATSPLAPVSRAVAGAQMGTILGWMSTRVLGQYDLLLVEDERPEDQDIVYYVGPNVLGLEKRFAFPPREFRLWLALHETTHRAQFTGIPWMREHFMGLVETALGAIDPDPAQFVAALRRMADDVRLGRNPLADGVLGLVAGPEERQALDRVQGLMSLLEGHGDLTMDRAGAAEIPSAERFSRVLRERRQAVRGPARLLQQVIGLEAKLRQYEEGEAFISAVEDEGGPALLDRVWDGPESLPSLSEIRDPAAWLSRVLADTARS
ncbi:MAG TPA: zinc-dependent metalloprotease [Acidimicrobiales bacterium]|nr:zinc-dependent metalloprotease [Acidimicrobiales bacterium]